MRFIRLALFCTFPAISPAIGRSQTAPAADTPPRCLVKLGLNAGRAMRYSGYYGLAARLPISVALETALGSHVTLYGQLDADVGVVNHNEYLGDQHFTVPSGALGLGVRYYYKQAQRAQQGRAHGLFEGSYLALEAHNEAHRRYDQPTDFAPSLNVVWGTQHRLNRYFLFDFNAGIGLGPARNNSYLGYHTNIGNINTQLNFGLYFGR